MVGLCPAHPCLPTRIRLCSPPRLCGLSVRALKQTDSSMVGIFDGAFVDRHQQSIDLGRTHFLSSARCAVKVWELLEQGH